MFKKNSLLCLVGAREGSKGIKDKNIINVAGRPLIGWAIASALGSKYIDRTIVSTDGEEIARIAKEMGADVPFMRPAEISQDSSPMPKVIRHAIKWLEKEENSSYDYVIQLQPTSPLITSKHIDEAIEFYLSKKKTEKDVLVSVVRLPKKSGWLMSKEGDYLKFCLDVKGKQRQELPEYYLPNGAIKVGPSSILKEADFYSGNVIPFIMNEEDSLDIDARDDLEKAENILKNRVNIKNV